jgi:hypothetical protein
MRKYPNEACCIGLTIFAVFSIIAGSTFAHVRIHEVMTGGTVHTGMAAAFVHFCNVGESHTHCGGAVWCL